LLAASLAFAQLPNQLPQELEGVGIDQKLNARIALDTELRDENGSTVRVRDYFKSKPVVLSLVYYECPMLCTLTLNGALRAFRANPLEIGRDYDVLTVSFDHREQPPLAAGKKQAYVSKYKREGGEDGWHFLTGTEESIRRLTESVGFRFKWDEKTGQFSHAAALILLTPEGRISRYLYGIEYSARDLRLGLVEASANKIGGPVEQLLLFCFHYDPVTGKYGPAIMNIVRLGGVLTVLGIIALWVILNRIARRRKFENVEDLPAIS
jgi:protein SCO1/2